MILGSSAPASAYVTDNLAFFFDFSTLTSVSSGDVIPDGSPNGRDATVNGPLTFNSTTHALEFPGGPNETAYLALAGDFSDFSSGLTIEFEGEFGSTRADWERIFDFGIPGGEANDIWLGQYYDSNELGLEVWLWWSSVAVATRSRSAAFIAERAVRLGGPFCRVPFWETPIAEPQNSSRPSRLNETFSCLSYSSRVVTKG